jgi:hypothetical protein
MPTLWVINLGWVCLLFFVKCKVRERRHRALIGEMAELLHHVQRERDEMVELLAELAAALPRTTRETDDTPGW